MQSQQHLFTIVRNGQEFGPYTSQQIESFFQGGQALLNDLVRIDGGYQMYSLKEAYARCGIPLPTQESIRQTFSRISSVIFPTGDIVKCTWLHERRFLLLAAIGLIPLSLASFRITNEVMYIGIATYFTCLWGLFFYVYFRNSEARPRVCVGCTLFTAFIATTLVLLLHLTRVMYLFNVMSGSGFFPFRLIGMFLAAGLPEEIAKSLCIFWLANRPGKILQPKSIVLYGLFSGLGFGIKEGVNYQMGLNRTMGTDAAFFLNVLRLTSLPFLHAIWCGLSSYFVAFSSLFPKSRRSLLIIGILIPATLHALHNSVGPFCLITDAFSVLLLTIYFSKTSSLGSSLS